MKYYSEEQVNEMLKEQKLRILINLIGMELDKTNLNYSLKPLDVSIRFPEPIHEERLPIDIPNLNVKSDT